MFNTEYKIALCAYVQDGKVKYCKEYTFKGRIVSTESIPYSEFVRLSDQQKMLAKNEANKPLRLE